MKIKNLEWENQGSRHIAKSPYGFYEIVVEERTGAAVSAGHYIFADYYFSGRLLQTRISYLKNSKNVDAAKQKCEMDYFQRMAAFIESE